MSQSAKEIIIMILIAIFGFLGILLGNIPNLIPGFAKYIPSFHKIETGLLSLNNYTQKEINGSKISLGILNPEDVGYRQILEKLESYAPAVAYFVKYNSGVGKIQIYAVRSVMKIDRLYPFVSIFIGIDYTGQAVCFMSDLMNLINTAKIRFFTTLGFAIAFLSLVLETVYNVFIISKKGNNNEIFSSTDRITCENKERISGVSSNVLKE